MFPEVSDPYQKSRPVSITLFNQELDPEGTSLVPYMDHFYNNSLQTELMREMAVDVEVLGEHLVLLGNQVRFFTPFHLTSLVQFWIRVLVKTRYGVQICFNCIHNDLLISLRL